MGSLKFQYIMTFEFHKDGTCHIHFISNLYLKSRELAEAWGSLGGGFTSTKGNFGRKAQMSTDDGELDPKEIIAGAYRIGHYIGKYITKGSGNQSMPWDAYSCSESGAYRKVPWRRWTAPRAVSDYIRYKMGLTREPSDKCRLVVTDSIYLSAVQDAYPRWDGGSRKTECGGHLYNSMESCGPREGIPPSVAKVPLCGYQIMKDWKAFSDAPPAWLFEDGMDAWRNPQTRFELFTVNRMLERPKTHHGRRQVQGGS